MQEETDPMEGRVVRFDALREGGTAMAFIDSVLPGHLRMNYAVVGDTAVEDPDFRPALTDPHKFQIGMFEAPPGNGPGWHTHDYVELFIPLTGRWRFEYGEADPDAGQPPRGSVELGVWDAISFPAGLWRRFENCGEENAWALAVLDPHETFAFKDPWWPESTVRDAAAAGVEADDHGKMVKPENFDELERTLRERIRRGAVSVP